MRRDRRRDGKRSPPLPAFLRTTTRILVAELTTMFGRVRQGEVDEMHAPGLAESLGRVATSNAQEDGRPCQQQSDPGRIANAGPRTIAVAALVETVMEDSQSQMVHRAAWKALHDAAERGGSFELVCGLARLFDTTVPADARPLTGEEHRETQKSQGGFAAMLAAVATFSPGTKTASAARDAITERVGALAALLRTSTDPEVRGFALGALEASASDVAVDAIKSFILLAPMVATGAGEPPTRDLAIQRDSRAIGLTACERYRLRRPRPPLRLYRIRPGCRPTLPRKLKIPFGHEAAVSLNDEAIRLQQSGAMDAALQKAQEAVKADGEFADAHGTLGSIFYQTGKKDDALRELRVATEKEPSYTWAYCMQALIHMEKRQFKDAEAALALAVKSDPSYPWTYSLLGEVYLEQNRDREAIAELRRLQGSHPEVGAIYAQLAYIYHERIALADASAYELAYDANSKMA